ncbi:MAG TPA: ABC transporter substrate-binding protein [Segeticoccus sp.]|uniref:peptide ABC transporter substrate-binding protein n=1 Tax=Segeticoccus sp. TaxID=2706531 RepID=UPI002D80C596|nr:ABC transporter substrate-binding protein [Segeticoccus sp.]HET8601828.1 ABC transporter substrate-binding protein [Segeticoccus sp.]
MRRHMKTMAIAGSVALLAAACGGGGGGGEAGSTGGSGSGSSASASGGGAAGGSFSVARGEPTYLFPPGNCYESECSAILDTLWAGLVEIKDNKLQYRVAKSITSDDQIHWDIKLNKGYTFANGEPVNAAAFMRAWNYTSYGPNAQQTSGFFTQVKGYDALQGDKPKAKKLSGLKKVNDYEFKVTLDAPFSQFPYMLTYKPAFAAVSQKCLDNVKACNEGKMPIGDGPYQMDGQWAHNDHIKVKKNPGYPGEDAGKADEITFKLYQKMDTAYRDWQAGNLDIVAPIPSQVDQAKQAAGDRQLTATSSSFTYVGLPMYVDYLKNPKIRHALSLAIDRKALIKNLLAGLGKPAQSVVSPVVPGGGGDHCKYCEYDPKRAKQLAKEAGGLPNTITIWVNTGAGNDEWVQAVGDMWKQTFGVNYKIKAMEWPEYLKTMGAHKATGPFRLGWLMDYPSMINYMKPIYFKNAPSNYMGYDNPKFEALIKKGSAASSNDEAIKYYSKAEDMLIEDMPVIPILYGQEFVIWSQHVGNVNYNAVNGIDYTQVTVNQ